jgi:hypothetical protein
MNTIRTESTEIRELTGNEIDGIAGGSVVTTVTHAIGSVANAIGDALGELVGSKFPIQIDLSGAAKAGGQIGRGSKGPK